MQEIHNNGKRMPMIIPRKYEKNWLNPDLTKDDVMAFCKGIGSDAMQANTIAKFNVRGSGPERRPARRFTVWVIQVQCQKSWESTG
jgi:hypothetical protein